MTKEELIAKTEKELNRARANGDWFSVTSHELLLADLNKLTDKEYDSYIKARKLFSAASVRPIAYGGL